MASVMDNASGFVLTSSALFTRNVLGKFRREENSRTELLISRVFSVGFVAASLGLAFSFTDVPAAIRFMWQIVPLVGISLWMGLFWRRANRFGAWASFIGAAIGLLIARNVFGWHGDAGFPKIVLFYLSTGVVAGVVASLLTPPEPTTQLDRFYFTINTPVGQEHYLAEFERAHRPAEVQA
jgi:Na+/proline symporter